MAPKAKAIPQREVEIQENGKTRIITVYANQKVITTHKASCDKEHLYATINIEAMNLAARNFHGKEAGGFLLWCYFARHQDNHTFAFSPELAQEEFGLTDGVCSNAIKLLRAKGYLKLMSGQTQFAFYEMPQEPDENIEEN